MSHEKDGNKKRSRPSVSFGGAENDSKQTGPGRKSSGPPVPLAFQRKSEEGGGKKNELGRDAILAPHKFELSVKQKQDIKEAFNAFDVEGTGFMSTSDLKIALRALGFEPRKNDVSKIVERVDRNNTGQLCFADFLDVISIKMADKDTKEEIMKAFKLFDRDQSGMITMENLQEIAAELGEGLSEEELKEMIEEADINKDGAVDQDEFFRIMKKTSLY